MKHIYMLNILFKSHLIRHSDTGSAFKDTQRALEHLRHSESTQRALGHLKGTRALGGFSGTRRALRHLRHLGTRTLRALRHLEHLGTRELKVLGYLGIQGTLFSRLTIDVCNSCINCCL